MRPSLNPRQAPADAAVILPTVLRPSLLKAVRSVYAQNFAGHIHLLIGVDVHQGDTAILDLIQTECPSHVTLTVVDPGYSTSARHGGVHPNAYSGSLRTVLSYLANSRYIAYLDDNDWWGGNHLTLLKAAIAGRHWAWSGRWLVHPQTQWPICKDEWDSVGPGKGINAERFGGFVQPSGLMMDAQACHFLMPLWSLAAFEDGGGEDRLIFDQLNKTQSGAGTGQFTSFCTLSPDSLGHDHHKREFLMRGLHWIYDERTITRINDLEQQAQRSVTAHDWPNAQKNIDEILELHPHFAQALHLSSQVECSANAIDKAITSLARAIEINDESPSWTMELADLLGKAGRTEDENRVRATYARRFTSHKA